MKAKLVIKLKYST